MTTRPTPRLLLPALLLSLTTPALADLKLASPFTPHMVLQRDHTLPIWGWSDPGEQITVTFANQVQTTTASTEGKWRLDLAPLSASAESRSLTVKGDKTPTPITLDDVLVGEVWIASGQSNMDFTLSKSKASWAGVENEDAEIAAAHFPQVRMFLAEPIRSEKPQATVPGTWQVCTPENAPAFSAIAYYFARDLHQQLNIPIGILKLTYGASTAQAWIRREALEADPTLKPQLAPFDEKVASYTPPSEDDLAKWQAATEAAKAANKKLPGRPKPHPSQDQHNPTVLYNGVVAPITPYAIRGVIWYQGESITDPKDLFPKYNETLIKDWRSLWGEPLPFYFCQLAAYAKTSPETREMQTQTLNLPNTAMAVTIDIGNKSNVHPKNKKDVGHRLAQIALARDYNQNVEYQGPTIDNAKREGNTIKLTFTHADGLSSKDGPPNTFELAGPDHIYKPATATLQGNELLLHSDALEKPTSLRYAWSNFPDSPNLYNAAGLPAAPFRIENINP